VTAQRRADDGTAKKKKAKKAAKPSKRKGTKGSGDAASDR
jgi:hypothetical protein